MEPSLQTTNGNQLSPALGSVTEQKAKVKQTRNKPLARERQVAAYKVLADNPHNWMTVEEICRDPRVAVIPGGAKDVQNALRRVVELNLALRKKTPGQRIAYRWNVNGRPEEIEILVSGALGKYEPPYPVATDDRFLEEPMEVSINGINFELAGASKVMLERTNGKVKVRVLG